MQKENHLIKQGNINVSDFFTALTILWEELDNFLPIPPCSCGSTTYVKEDRVVTFLTSLNESFDVVKIQVLVMKPMPNLNRVISLVL